MGFLPAFLVAFPPETRSKSVQCAIRVTRPNQKVINNAHPNTDHKALLVAMNRCSMRVCICPNMAVVAVENPLSGEAGLIGDQYH
jgi:hypothetical protein